MSLTGWLWGASQVDEAIDKATSELLPTGTEDIALNLEISDQIRSKSVPPKDAMRALKRRLNHKNPNVQLLALSLTDTCVKNGGDHFLVEVASREFMDNLVSILKIPVLNLDVKNAILRHIQNWAVAFEGKPSLSYVCQVYRQLQSEGYTFPPKDIAVASSAMVDTQTAPEWIDSDVCLRCRTPFTFTNRKHHCRNCGQVFDQQCSSKSLPLPHFGIQQEVRVCDSCYVKLTRSKFPKDDKKHHRSSSTHHRSARDLADEELQRAIQLSLEEVGAANVNGRNSRPGYTSSQPEPSKYGRWQSSEPPVVDRSSRPFGPPIGEDDENDPELKAAIEASLREANAPKPSAPVETPRSEVQNYGYPQAQSYPETSSAVAAPQPSYDLQPLESDVILTFSQTVQEVEARGGRDMSRYPAVNELYDKANGLRPKLALSLDDADRKEKALSEMHDKLSQAVKLYDKLLTEQLSRPSWRSMPQQEPATYNSVNGSYAQWTPSQQYGAPQVPQSPAPANATYAPVRQLSYGTVSQTPVQQHYAPAPAPNQYYSSPPSVQEQLPQQVQAPPAPNTQYASYQQSTPVPPTPVTAIPSIQSPPPQSQTSSTGPYSAPAPAISSQPQYAQAPPAPTLSRQNTLSYASPPPTQPSYAQPSSQPPAQVQPQYYQAPPQTQAQPQVQPQLPHFPVAPTSNPQSFSLYGPTPALEQTERKEALLIDL